MKPSGSVWGGAIACVVTALALVGAWSWQAAVGREQPSPAAIEPWQQVQQHFPMPEPTVQMPEAAEASLQAVVRANPFSPIRRQAQPTSGGGEGTEPAVEPAAPQYAFRGRILMGSTQRAIIEEVKSKKTYFVQAGQEVEQFKVLDIEETHVVILPVFSKEPVTLSLSPKP